MINLIKSGLKKKHKTVRVAIELTCHWRQQLYTSLLLIYHLSNSLTGMEPHTATTNQPEDSKEKKITIEKNIRKQPGIAKFWRKSVKIGIRSDFLVMFSSARPKELLKEKE